MKGNIHKGKCRECGTVFVQHLGLHKGRKREFCHQKCQRRHWHKQQRAKQLAARPTKTCIQCGGEFIPRNVAHKLCSDACRYAHHLVDRRVRYRLRVGIPLDAPVQRPHVAARVVDGVPCCVVCGGALPEGSVTNRRLCSRECRLARRRELERAAREQRLEPVDDEPVDWERVVRSIAERSGVEAAAQFLDSLNARRRTAGEEEVRVWEHGEA